MNTEAEGSPSGNNKSGNGSKSLENNATSETGLHSRNSKADNEYNFPENYATSERKFHLVHPKELTFEDPFRSPSNLGELSSLLKKDNEIKQTYKYNIAGLKVEGKILGKGIFLSGSFLNNPETNESHLRTCIEVTADESFLPTKIKNKIPDLGYTPEFSRQEMEKLPDVAIEKTIGFGLNLPFVEIETEFTISYADKKINFEAGGSTTFNRVIDIGGSVGIGGCLTQKLHDRDLAPTIDRLNRRYNSNKQSK